MKKNDILKIHGTDYRQMTRRLLEAADLASLIGSRRARIALKPNVLGTVTPEEGATTHTELVCGAIEYLQERGFSDITIMEGAWVGDNTHSAYRLLGYYGIAERYGVTLLDLQKDKSVSCSGHGMKIHVCRSALETDFMINIPVLKGHCQTGVTCAMKNMKGVIPNSEKRRFHTLGLHKPIAHLNTIVRNDFILVDNICGDLTFEEGGRPTVMDNILAFRDPVLCDAYTCGVVGCSVSSVGYIGLAERLGVGSADLSGARIIDLNRGSTPYSGDSSGKRTGGASFAGSLGCCGGSADASVSARVASLSAYTVPREACSACYGYLLRALEILDEEGLLREDLPGIAIGQGYRGQCGEIGVGRCTTGCGRHLEGCPAKPEDIVRFLKGEWL